jgi:5-formyltetrahydrofolate cyclo-ligase
VTDIGGRLRGVTTLESKRSLRNAMRKQRRDLDSTLRAQGGVQIADVATASLVSGRSQRLACYLPNDGEMDLTVLIQRLWNLGHKTYLPILHGPKLRFLPYESSTRLTENHFGIPEPEIGAEQRCRPSQLHTILMPLVAFDPDGNRLGMGGGYYDQTFAFKRRPRLSVKPRLIGIAHEFQRVARLPTNEWDVPLDGILTERALRLFDR